MRYLFFFFFLLNSLLLLGQSKTTYTRADSLRGTLNEWRSCYDVTHYDLTVRVDPENRFISGKNIITFKTVRDFTQLQVDLFENMEIEKIETISGPVEYQRDGKAVFVHFPETQKKGKIVALTIHYKGHPIVAKRPPWDGGFSWEKDKNGTHWIGVTSEGIGASHWWPNKDHLSDEPDSMMIRVEAPAPLTCVANGQLASRHRLDDQYIQWVYRVSYPINNYNVTLNLADYAYFSDIYRFKDGEKLRMKYFVLNHNLEKGMEQFKQVKSMFGCFENLYGKYPFILDGYTLVETSYWGMEHQSAVAYGNNFKNNGFGFDFIIIHESGHEYWGNSVSCKDHAELWIHEALTTYTDALFVECQFGHDKGQDYLDSLKTMIRNRKPILGPLGVNYKDWGDADMYYKGAWMLHSIRNLIHDDILWFDILKEMYNEFKYSNVESKDIIDFIDKRTSFKLTPIFNQYLKHPSPPRFVYWIENKGKKSILHYKWTVDEKDFQMPLRMKTDQNEAFITLYPSSDFQIKTFEIKDLKKISLDHQSFYFTEEHMKEPLY